MSYNWCFHSFDYDRFAFALVHSRKEIVDIVIAQQMEWRDSENEIQRFAAVGRRLVEKGFNYEYFESRDIKTVDMFAFAVFHVISDKIDLQSLSSAFLSPYVTSDLPSHLEKKSFWRKPQLIPADRLEYMYLPFFTHRGRRLGQTVPSACEYVALDLNETRALAREIEKYLASPEGQMLDAGHDNTIAQDFLGPVRAAIRSGKGLHAQLS